MSLTIYGPPQSRAMRVLWLAHELGLDFVHHPGFADGAASAALLAHLIQTGQHKPNLSTIVRRHGGKSIAHHRKQGPAYCHHLLNEREIPPLTLPSCADT